MSTIIVANSPPTLTSFRKYKHWGLHSTMLKALSLGIITCCSLFNLRRSFFMSSIFCRTASAVLRWSHRRNLVSHQLVTEPFQFKSPDFSQLWIERTAPLYSILFVEFLISSYMSQKNVRKLTWWWGGHRGQTDSGNYICAGWFWNYVVKSVPPRLRGSLS